MGEQFKVKVKSSELHTMEGDACHPRYKTVLEHTDKGPLGIRRSACDDIKFDVPTPYTPGDEFELVLRKPSSFDHEEPDELRYATMSMPLKKPIENPFISEEFKKRVYGQWWTGSTVRCGSHGDYPLDSPAGCPMCVAIAMRKDARTVKVQEAEIGNLEAGISLLKVENEALKKVHDDVCELAENRRHQIIELEMSKVTKEESIRVIKGLLEDEQIKSATLDEMGHKNKVPGIFVVENCSGGDAVEKRSTISGPAPLTVGKHYHLYEHKEKT